jgi:hypothetical protein
VSVSRPFSPERAARAASYLARLRGPEYALVFVEMMEDAALRAFDELVASGWGPT